MYRYLKHPLDMAAAFLLLIPGSVLIGFFAWRIRNESAGPAIFAQQRMGRGQKPFICYKLRSMAVATANVPTHEMNAKDITPTGAFIRRWKIDELPQLINVLKGEMSLVGPRPCLPSQQALIAAREREGVFALRPGITGLAQVMGVDMSIPDRLAAIDGQYARSMSLMQDVTLMLRTLLPKRGTPDN